MTSDYRPIACGAYDEIELMAMHRARVELFFRADDGSEQRLQGQVYDTAIHDGAEFLVLQTEGGERRVRLDRIERICELRNGREWRQEIVRS